MQAMVPTSAAPAVPRMDSMSLPNDARYGADAVLLKSSRVSERFFPQNAGTFSPSSSRVIRFDISSTNFTDLSEARLCATLVVQGGNATVSAILDGGLGGMIERISIMNASGQLLERIDDYALLQTVLNQCSQRARDDADGLWLEENFIADINNVPNAAAAADSPDYMIQPGVTERTRDLCHKLHGAWFQTHKKKLLPPGVAYKVEIELVSNANQCLQIKDTAGLTEFAKFELNDVYIDIPSVQIMSQGFEDSTARLLSRGWSWTGSTYRRYSFTTTGASAAGTQFNIPDKSLALTGLIAVGRTTANIGAAGQMQNYVRDGDFFGSALNTASSYNVQIGSQQYPANRIDYLPVANAAGDAADGTMKLSGPVTQIKAVLGDVPLGSAKSFGQIGAAADGSVGGTGFLAIQVGFREGQGIDTQTASLPVQLFCGTKAASTLTVYCQATAMFRMEPGQGMMSVVSYI